MKALKVFIIVLGIILIGFPVSGRSVTKKYITTENVIKVVYVATNFESIAKRELNKKIIEVYSLAYETVFGEP